MSNKVKPSINHAKVSEAQSTIAGLNYLMMNTTERGLSKIARILQNCANDVCIALEQGELSEDEFPLIVDHNLLATISFLSKYASIDDKQIKEEILSEILKMKNWVVERN